jgi:type IV pilus assembly protein PilA
VKKNSRGLTLLEIVITLAIIGVLAAISVPNFMKLLARSKQSEAKSNLRALYDLEQAHLMEFGVFTNSVARAAFAPERGNRYQYTLSASPQVLDDRTGTLGSTALNATTIMVDTFRYGVAAASGIPAPSPCSVVSLTPGPVGAAFTAQAQGNVDEDAAIDIWSISTENRSLGSCSHVAGNVAAGEPANDVNDVND